MVLMPAYTQRRDDGSGGPVGSVALRGRDTAWFLHRVLGCDVAALVVDQRGMITVWWTSWREVGDGEGAEFQVGGWSSSGTVVQPLQADTVYARPGGLELSPGIPQLRCQLAIPLVVTADGTVAWCLGREGRNFSAAEVEHATVLMPGLRLRLERSAARAERAFPGTLTGRERGVLELIALGMTSRAVARRLHISERTVHKHLEHIYRKTGCGDRLTAVRRVLEAGLIPR
jgi:DNA-binding CsgD family transcriptional regulator